MFLMFFFVAAFNEETHPNWKTNFVREKQFQTLGILLETINIILTLNFFHYTSIFLEL